MGSKNTLTATAEPGLPPTSDSSHKFAKYSRRDYRAWTLPTLEGISTTVC